MNVFRIPTPRHERVAGILLLLGLGACATQSRSTEKLPFHVALAPASITPEPSLRELAGNATELNLAFDEKKLMAQVTRELGQTFIKVTRLSPPAPDTSASANRKAWANEAQQKGADVLLIPTLRYDRRINTELNGLFVLNLPLFALGGPFCWFVADRSYHCQARLDGEVFDVTAANKRQVVDRSVRVHTFKEESAEAPLSFRDRATGVGPYLLSLVCPAGILATESAGIPAELDSVIVAQLCQDMTKSLRDGTAEIRESDLVLFFPQNVEVKGSGQDQSLVGEFMLKLGTVNALGMLRYRGSAAEEWKKGAWSAPRNDAADDRRVYPFALRLDGWQSDTVQVEVEQLDTAGTRRTFTFGLEKEATK